MSTQKRKMPSKSAIYVHWYDILWDGRRMQNNKRKGDRRYDTCWGCGFEVGTQRCHIIDRCAGGSDEVSNLVLLCVDCHRTQELVCQTDQGRKKFVEQIVDGAPFMPAKIAKYKNLIDLGYEPSKS